MHHFSRFEDEASVGGGGIFRPRLRDVSLLAGDDGQSSGECDATRTILIKGAPSSSCH